jgi:toxin ParE1/3/4
VKVTFSKVARDDSLDIALYIAQDAPARALTFVDELEARCNKLGGPTRIGTARPELGEGVRVLPRGHCLIFYREQRKRVRIERVMHGARDIGGDDFEATEPAPAT